MRTVLLGIALTIASGAAIAECKTYISHGQYKHSCSSSTDLRGDGIEYTEVSRAGLFRSGATVNTTKPHNMAQTAALPQPAQIRQLVEFANKQGCTWEGTQHSPSLICPDK